jgi:hypothetical protein
MNEIAPEIVRIGVGNACVRSVTPERVEYFDDGGLECFVDLKECARNRVRYVESWREDGARDGDSRMVGKSGFLDDSPCMQFLNDRSTRFHFGSVEGVLALKLLLAKVSWRALSF